MTVPPTRMSSGILDESGTKDSSAPDDSLPGFCDGITKVTSNCGISAPTAKEPLLSIYNSKKLS